MISLILFSLIYVGVYTTVEQVNWEKIDQSATAPLVLRLDTCKTNQCRYNVCRMTGITAESCLGRMN